MGRRIKTSMIGGTRRRVSSKCNKTDLQLPVRIVRVLGADQRGHVVRRDLARDDVLGRRIHARPGGGGKAVGHGGGRCGCECGSSLLLLPVSASLQMAVVRFRDNKYSPRQICSSLFLGSGQKYIACPQQPAAYMPQPGGAMRRPTSHAGWGREGQ